MHAQRLHASPTILGETGFGLVPKELGEANIAFLKLQSVIGFG